MVEAREGTTQTNGAEHRMTVAPTERTRPMGMERSPSDGGAPSQLVTEMGKTTIANTVVSKIAGIAAREISGVHELSARGAGGLVSNLTSKVSGGDTQATAVDVEVGEREAAVDLAMSVNYGVNIAQVAEAVRRNIINRVQSMTGLTVREVNIDVNDLYFPNDPRNQPDRRVE